MILWFKRAAIFVPIFCAHGALRNFSMRAKKGGYDATRSLTPLYSPRGENQKKYVEYLNDPECSILFGIGPAGTGKTLFACSTAVNELRRGSIQKIILTRPVVSVDEDIGYLPGSLIAKMDPWTRPVFDILGDFYSQKDVDSMLHSGTIEISPLAYMRGRTFKRSFIIADEMQNSSPNQMLMLTTRLGEGSKMVVTGDLNQSDRMKDNGLLDIMTRINRYSGNYSSIRVVELGADDIERSPTVAKILDIYRDPTPITITTPITNSTVNNNTTPHNVSSISITTRVKKEIIDVDNDCALIPLRYYKELKK